MPSKSAKSSKAINRPFDPEILRRARKIADSYQIILQFEDGKYYGRTFEIPNAMNDGKTPDECVEATRDILTTLIAYMLEIGEIPPPSASDSKRTEQINIRLTAEEKLVLEGAARNKGFRGISDFVRTASLSQVKK